jgi:hypothetical protein
MLLVTNSVVFGGIGQACCHDERSSLFRRTAAVRVRVTVPPAAARLLCMFVV